MTRSRGELARRAPAPDPTPRTRVGSMNVPRVLQAIVDLDGWLETMRQAGGYGGPVAHWWQNRYRYAGVGLDWRYEGLLVGYATLLAKSSETRWRARLQQASDDLVEGQRSDGGYRSSRFEINPGRLGTPHEAAATLGLLTASPYLMDPAMATEVARRNLDHLIAQLWDGTGFADVAGGSTRVPNKLATLARALMLLAERTGDPAYLRYARAAIDTVVAYQVRTGAHAGAIHQYAPGGEAGDGRFFPYYIARCVPALVEAATVLDDPRYADAARSALGFLGRTMHVDGHWPQVVYAKGHRAEWPRWIAATADVLLAFDALHEPLPGAALGRLLAGQTGSGGFRTAEGFAAQIRQRGPGAIPDHRDVTPVVGWNDKVLRLLAVLVPDGSAWPPPRFSEVHVDVVVGRQRAQFRETATDLEILADGALLYRWSKHEPWPSAMLPVVDGG